MRIRPHKTAGRAAIVIVLFLAVAAGAGYFLLPSGGAKEGQDESGQTLILHQVARGDFEAFITEPGEISSSSNIEIRCRVKSHGSAGTPILKICDNGIHVKKDEFLVQFDDSALQNQLLQQKILVANDTSQLTQSESTHETSKKALEEYTDGLYEQEKEVLEGLLFAAQENMERSTTQLNAHRLLRERNFISAAQLRAVEFGLEKAKKEFAVATRKLAVYEKFTKDKTIGELKAAIRKAAAREDAARSTLELSQQKQAEILQQISDCKIVAPDDGRVVYASDRDRRGDPIVIEEGTVIRENQVVIRLPDFDQMQVDVKVNESHYKRVKKDDPVRIELDADPEHPLRGKVKSIAEAPFPVRWHGAPVEYGAIVEIVDPPANIRPGWRAKVRISFESQSDVLQVPLAAVIVNHDRHFCLIRQGEKWITREIEIGSNNNAVVIVMKGLDAGDQVSLTPFRFIERNDLPGPKAAPDGEPNKLTQTSP